MKSFYGLNKDFLSLHEEPGTDLNVKVNEGKTEVTFTGLKKVLAHYGFALVPISVIDTLEACVITAAQEQSGEPGNG